MAALDGYLAQVTSLLDDFSNVEYTVDNLTTYINDARVQIAGASESIRGPATLNLVSGQQSYSFLLASQLPIGVQGVLAVRMIRIANGAGGWQNVEMRAWEYFWTFRLCQQEPAPGMPTMASQQRSGVRAFNPGDSGQLWFDPIPNFAYVTSLDSVQYPVPLVAADNTPELLPSPWTEAVQYYAAYLALLNAQRYSDATAMFARYEQFELRATQMTTASRLPRNYPGGVGATLASQNVPLTGPLGGGRR